MTWPIASRAAKVSFIAALAVSASVMAPQPRALAATIFGGDWAGGLLAPANGDILAGTFTNVGSFIVGAGTQVFVQPGAFLSLSANTISIAGTLNANAAGHAGGLHGFSGNPGAGPGGGAGGEYGGSVHASGGAGGGFGGSGGNGGSSFGSDPLPSIGGGSYAAIPPVFGSGGGAAGDHGCCTQGPGTGIGGNGGAGGGGVALSANTSLVVTGSILAEGEDGFQGTPGDYPASGGGGGSGGLILLSGPLLLDGLLDVSGGDGADYQGIGNPGEAWGNGGGGGGGGRIVLQGTASFGGSFATDLAGGLAGASLNLLNTTPTAAMAGAAGSFANEATVPVDTPEPASMLLFGAGLLGLAGLRRRRRI